MRMPTKILVINPLFLMDNAVTMEYPGKKNSKSPYGINTIIYLFKDGIVIQIIDITDSKTTKIMSVFFGLFMLVFPESSIIKFQFEWLCI